MISFRRSSQRARSGPQNRDTDLRTHLIRVARIARALARPFGAGDVAYVCGLLHDLGKYNPEWQRFLDRAEAGEQVRLPPHASMGAAHAFDVCSAAGKHPLGRLMAYAIDGHHKGIPDWGNDAAGLSITLNEGNEDVRRLLAASLPHLPQDLVSQVGTPPIIQGGARDVPMLTRMVFGALVDADRLHSERTSSPEKFKLRRRRYSMASISETVDRFLDSLPGDPVSPIIQERRKLLQEAREAAASGTGALYTLTAPTGLGKTFSSLSFAARLANVRGSRRIIYVAPFISVTEQTADDYRRALGPDLADAVLEHHSQIATGDGAQAAMTHALARENWDSPIVVTTAVQFFESLYTNHPGRSRKLPRIAGSIILVDEAQFVPAEFRGPIVQAMNVLMEEYGVTFVLMTATQPDLGSKPWCEGDVGLGPTPIEIVSDPMRLFRMARRVRTHIPTDLHTVTRTEDIATAMMAEPRSSLTIMNTKAGARALHACLPGDTLFLSGDMCGAHRSAVVDQVRQQSADKLVRVVSTSLIEAGIDIDFPVVFRALTGLTSLVQAAGRCNRHGLLSDLGEFHVFVSEEPPFHIQREITAGRWILMMMKNRLDDLFSPETIHRYSGRIYGGTKADVKEVLTKHLASRNYAYRSASEAFRLIEDDQVSVVCPYGAEGSALANAVLAIAEGRHSGVDGLFEKLQRFTVSMRRKKVEEMVEAGALTRLGGFDLCVSHSYHPIYGLGTLGEAI